MKSTKYFALVFLVLFFLCSKEDVVEDTFIGSKIATETAGVVLTFDDDYVEDWKMADYQTKMENLVAICNYVKQNYMRFYTLSDLAKIKA